MKQSIKFVGLDVHKDNISVAVAEGGPRGEVRTLGAIAHTGRALEGLVKRLSRDGSELDLCTEAWPCGYGVHRHLTSLGHACTVVAPALIPRRPGDRVKTNRRDAEKLAKAHRAGELVAVWVPDQEHEAMRDLVRAREAAVRDVRKARQRLSGFLLRHGKIYARKAWSGAHRRWLARLRFEQRAQQIVLQESIEAIEAAEQRRDRLTREIENLLPEWSMAPVVSALQALRAVGPIVAVTLAAEVVRNPQVFLFDEPLSNLDAKLRAQMRIEIKRIHQRVQTTTVYVTHDQVEAMTLADRVVVMNGGLIEQVGSPGELYRSPRTRFVAGFIGSPAMNFLPCVVEEAGAGLVARVNGALALALPVPGEREARCRAYAGRKMILGVRPENVREPRADDGEAGVGFTVTPDVVEPLGMETMVYFSVDGAEVCARVAPDAEPRVGEALALAIDSRRVHLIDPETDQVI